LIKVEIYRQTLQPLIDWQFAGNFVRLQLVFFINCQREGKKPSLVPLGAANTCQYVCV